MLSLSERVEDLLDLCFVDHLDLTYFLISIVALLLFYLYFSFLKIGALNLEIVISEVKERLDEKEDRGGLLSAKS